MSEELTPNQEPIVEQQAPIQTENTHPNTESASPGKIPTWLLATNLLLVAAVIVLFVLYFVKGSGSTGPGMEQALAKANKGDITVAYVNNDSILEHYELVKKLKGELQAKGDRFSAEVANRQAAFEKDAAYFQEQVQKKTISEQSAQEIYGSLMENQQKIYELRDKYAGELQQSEADMNVALLDSVMNFLDRYNQKYKFDYILGFNKGGNILYANDTLDITNDVIRELNAEYKKRNP